MNKKIEVQCLHSIDKILVKPNSKGFNRTKEGKVFYHCLMRNDCVEHIGCNGIIYLSSDEQKKFTPEEIEKIPECFW